MLHKSCSVKVKAVGEADGLTEGQFRAVVSVFGNKDSYGDVVVAGAFAENLAAWQASGDSIPMYWSHQLGDPDMNIGWVVEAKETEVGLEILGQIDLDDDARKARQVYRLLKGRRVTQFSFSYDIDEAAFVETEDDWFYELRKLRVFEVGPTPVGANQETELLAVKAAGERASKFAESIRAKAGRTLSAANETVLRDAQTQISAAAQQIADVLSTVDSADDEKAKANEPAKDEEPGRAKSDEPMRATPAELSNLQTIELADAS